MVTPASPAKCYALNWNIKIGEFSSTLPCDISFELSAESTPSTVSLAFTASIVQTMPSSTHLQTYSLRADNPSAPTLTSYLLQLISIKKSNLCVSADVHTSSALLRLAEDIGDYICVLKTHADIVDDFSEQTIKRLSEVSRRKNFLLFEDRKFGDIGSMSRCTPGLESDRPRVTRFADK